MTRQVPPSAKLAADALLVLIGYALIIAVASCYPQAPSKPRFPPASERREPARLPR